MQIKIETDALFITNRLKQIDQNYFVVYNTKKSRYELHNSKQLGDTFCLVCPYKNLDERFVILAQKTQSKNIDKLIAEIDKQNEKLDKQNIKNLTQKIGEML